MSLTPQKEVQLANNRAARFKATAQQAEILLEEKSRQLYEVNNQLEAAKNNLTKKVSEQTAELRQKNQELKKASRHKSEFLANVSHELRTPLNAITALTELLLETDTSENQDDYLLTVSSASKSLLFLINDILDLSKIEAGKMTIETQIFNPQHELEQLIRLFEYQIEEKNVSIELLCSAKLPDYIQADLNRIKQIADNLISNSVKFTPRGGIRIRLDYIADASIPNQGQLLMAVIDTGTGIRKDKLAMVFSAFEQASVSQGGTGLGLSICHKLSALMKGDIQCWSKIGLGSIFKTTLPVQQAKAPPKKSQRQEQNKIQNSYKILIAEDNLVNQKVIGAQLQSLGHTAFIVDNGQQALDQRQKDSFDLIFLDIQMPVLDGEQTLKAIKSSSTESSNDICIALTASSFKGERERFLKLGFDDYLSKPLSLDTLRECIEQNMSVSPTGDLETFEAKDCIDMKFIESQFGAHAANILAQLTPVFIEQSTLQFEELEQAIHKQEHHNTRTLSHSLKGAAISVGAQELSETLNLIETSTVQDNLAQLLTDAKSQFANVSEELQNLTISLLEQ